MRRISKLFLALAIVAGPLTLASCDNDPWGDDNYYYNDLVSDAVRNYLREYPSGSSYYTAYNWFYYYYPEATTSEFYAFMDAVGSNNNYNWNNNYRQQENKQVNGLISEAQTLTGEWDGNMTVEYTEDATQQRKSDSFKANMKFFQYNSSANSLQGNGVEVDTDAQGKTKTLSFSWKVLVNGNIEIKYSKTGTIFILDINATNDGFHLGYDETKGYDTFYGVARSTNTTDVMRFDLARQRPANAKAANAFTRASSKASFGSAKENDYAKKSAGAVNGLHER
jgi:lipoprotein